MNKKEMKSSQTREKLCNAFIELYSDKPIERISVKEITDSAGYNRATFYIYYKDIYDILESIEKRLLKMAEENINILAEKSFKKNAPAALDFLNMITGFYHSNEKAFSTLMIRDIAFVEAVKGIAKNVILKRQNSLSQEKYNEIEYMIEYQLSAVIGMLNMWISKGKDISFENLSALVFKISTTGVLTSINSRVNE